MGCCAKWDVFGKQNEELTLEIERLKKMNTELHDNLTIAINTTSQNISMPTRDNPHHPYTNNETEEEKEE